MRWEEADSQTEEGNRSAVAAPSCSMQTAYFGSSSFPPTSIRASPSFETLSIASYFLSSPSMDRRVEPSSQSFSSALGLPSLSYSVRPAQPPAIV